MVCESSTVLIFKTFIPADTRHAQLPPSILLKLNNFILQKAFTNLLHLPANVR